MKVVDEKADEIERPIAASTTTIQDRIAAFQMLDSMQEATQSQKCLRLSLVGFHRNDIASMLQTTPAVVSQNLYYERNRAKKAPRGKLTPGS